MSASQLISYTYSRNDVCLMPTNSVRAAKLLHVLILCVLWVAEIKYVHIRDDDSAPDDCSCDHFRESWKHICLQMSIDPISVICGTTRTVRGAGAMKRYGVRLSVPAWPTARNPLLQVCCCGPGGQEILIDCCSRGVRRMNAGSATLSAYVGS